MSTSPGGHATMHAPIRTKLAASAAVYGAAALGGPSLR
ncbi:340c2fbe-e6ed-4f3c-96e1-cc2c8733ab7f [Thermothielavioides terrestris]|uniref:340c2fbe-e6ed-4f3c-96e1-cc2c8733ab7f n=1 Tax=Thermothielavioides terrestris TaxID=2587410 RepID=A0A3S4F8D7_9PEZI|nr:340c2fbe-e6ed-4f3c-96e1-cc2c8733ab7f [Thermothielavioides terrestris]